MSNKNLRDALKNKNDEFYTLYEDIEKEVILYKEQLQGKSILCPCDNPKYSNFWKYFHLNFELLGLRKLTSVFFNGENFSYKKIYQGGNDEDVSVCIEEPLQYNGDFRNPDTIELIQENDIIITNPPFSLIRNFFEILSNFNKKFLIIAPLHLINNKVIISMFVNNQCFCGYNMIKNFLIEDNTIVTFNNISWLTNLDKHFNEIKLTKSIKEINYHKYVNYDAINIDKLEDIPYDYEGVIGVPINYIHKHNPKQFRIIGSTASASYPKYTQIYNPINSQMFKYVNDKLFSPVPYNMDKLNGVYILKKTEEKNVYYKFSQSDEKKYVSVFMRILIQRI